MIVPGFFPLLVILSNSVINPEAKCSYPRTNKNRENIPSIIGEEIHSFKALALDRFVIGSEACLRNLNVAEPHGTASDTNLSEEFDSSTTLGWSLRFIPAVHSKRRYNRDTVEFWDALFTSEAADQMDSIVKGLARPLMAGVLIVLFAVPNDVFGQASQHLVSPSDLMKATVDSSQQRQKNIDVLDQFFSSPEAQRALESAHISSTQVKKAVAGLSDEEVASLAHRANKTQTDFAAGNITDHDLLIILVCIAALVLVIVAVH